MSYFIELQNLINNYHNPHLIQRTCSPNENIIYHFHANGEITHQKGGWAYLNRSEFTEVDPLYDFKYSYKLQYPIEFINQFNNKVQYAIVTKEHAYLLRKFMEKIKNEINNFVNEEKKMNFKN